MDQPPSYEVCVPQAPPTYEESLYPYRPRSDSSQPLPVGKSLRRRRTAEQRRQEAAEVLTCPYCRTDVVTEVVEGPTMDMSFSKFLMNIFCCCVCCERTHYCPKCFKIIKSANRSVVCEVLT